MTSIMNGRERPLADKQRASSAEILDAASRAFARRGYSATSIDDIADELGCTKGRIYHYFRSKGDVFMAIHHRAMTWALDAVAPAAERGDLSAAERLRLIVKGHVTHMVEHSSYMSPAEFVNEINLAREGRSKDASVDEIFGMRRRFEAYFEQVIADGITSGEFRKCDAKLTAKAILGATNWMSVWFQVGSSADTPKRRAAIAEEFSAFAVAGMLAH